MVWEVNRHQRFRDPPSPPVTAAEAACGRQDTGRGGGGRCKRAAWTSCGLKGRVCYELPSLPGNPQAEQAPSHLPADVTAARRDREGGERRDLPTQKNISHGVCPSVDAAERWGTYLRIPTKRYRYINYECLFPYIEPAAPGKKRKKGGGAAHREKALASCQRF